MKIVYSSPVIFGVVSATSLGMAGRFQSSSNCCCCTGHGSSRA